MPSSRRSSLSRFLSSSEIDTRLHLSETLMSVAKTSFMAALFSSIRRGITFVRRRSSTKLRSKRLVVLTLIRCLTGSFR